MTLCVYKRAHAGPAYRSHKHRPTWRGTVRVCVMCLADLKLVFEDEFDLNGVWVSKLVIREWP